MNNLAVTDVLELAVIGLAVVQALTILLTVRRERDIADLRELVDQQRLRLVELTAWLAGRNSLQPRQLRAPEPEAKPQDTPEAVQPRTSDDEARAAKALAWQREIAARLQSSLKEEAPTAPEDIPDEPAATVGDSPKRTKKSFSWFREDPNEPSEFVEARKVAATLRGGAPPVVAAKAQEDSTAMPATAQDELERANKAISRLKEDIDKAREVASSSGTSPEKRDAS